MDIKNKLYKPYRVIVKVLAKIYSYIFYVIYLFYWEKPAHPNKILYLKPERITKSIEGSKINLSRRGELCGIILNGDWDKNAKLISNKKGFLILLSTMKSVFKDSGKIEDSDLYKKFYNRCKTKNDLVKLNDRMEKFVKKYSAMLEEIEERGFNLPRSIFDKIEYFHVCIDSNGCFLFLTGNHRLAIAKIAKVKLPVKVSYRHADWQRYRDKLYLEYKNGKTTKEEIQQIGHPDLEDIYE